MQSKLATWSTEDPNRRIDRLLRLIAGRDWLLDAAWKTLASKGAKTAGVDGETRRVVEQDISHYVDDIRSELLAGTYQPQPARRIYIPKANGKKRPLGIPTLRDRIVQRAMLMAMEPIWESDFHRLSYGFRPERSVHHAIRTVKLQLTDSGETKGRWVIEGDLASYFDTVHHRKLMRCVRRRICDSRFLDLLWKFIKAGHVDKGLFHAAHDGVPQGGVLSPLLSNIMLNEFDQWLEKRYLGKKARKDRWYWNSSIQREFPIAMRERRHWRPAVAYCRYADDFVLVVKGNKAHAEAIREECRLFLEDDLSLTLNMDKTHVTHVNDGFIFLGHRVVRKRGPNGTMRPVTSIPREKAKNFAASLAKELSSNHSANRIDMVDRLNRRLAGWANFYQHTDYTAITYRKIDGIVFWRFGHWLSRKYRASIKSMMRKHFLRPKEKQAKTWKFFGPNGRGVFCVTSLRRLVTSRKMTFRWRLPEANPYLPQEEVRNTVTSRYRDVAMALSHT
nr:group II intron reverse transcriptase/maturase [Halomonas halodenitrificans]